MQPEIFISCVFISGNSDCVQLMIDKGAYMEAHDCHYGTPLHVACARQHYDCAKVLLNAGESRGLYCKAGFGA